MNVKNLLDSLAQIPLLYPIKQLLFFIRINLWNLPSKKRREWLVRIQDVIDCPDRRFITTVPQAGKTQDGYLIMHNGIRIEPLSYYGYPMLRMFQKSKGIHEPQEERIFQEVLNVMPPEATMLELGSYWAFYSMWFHKIVKSPRCILVEPTLEGISFGKRNFLANGMTGEFHQAFIGSQINLVRDGIPTISVDSICNGHNVKHLDILHSDIQGYEVEMLEGAKEMFLSHRVSYCFISTHSNQLHSRCVEILKEYDYHILASIDLEETYSFDGLIVACGPQVEQPASIQFSKKPRSTRS